MAKAFINKETCKGCGLCVSACPKKIIALSKTEINRQGYYVAEIGDTEACSGCTLCAVMCPDVAIKVE